MASLLEVLFHCTELGGILCFPPSSVTEADVHLKWGRTINVFI